jgi:hypothetical protein
MRQRRRTGVDFGLRDAAWRDDLFFKATSKNLRPQPMDPHLPFLKKRIKHELCNRFSFSSVV